MVGDLSHHGNRNAKEVIATDYRFFFAKLFLQTGLSPADISLIDDVIVNQGGKVQNFHCRSGNNSILRDKSFFIHCRPQQ